MRSIQIRMLSFFWQAENDQDDDDSGGKMPSANGSEKDSDDED